MLYLLLATLCSSSIALVFKYSETRELNRYVITTVNYVTAVVISLYLIVSQEISLYVHKKAVNAFIDEFASVIIKDSGRFSASASLVWAIVLGAVTGIIFLAGFIYLQKSVKTHGAGLTGTFSKLGILIPILLSLILWKELPTALQWIGILLATVSIFIVNLSSKDMKAVHFHCLLLAVFFISGLGDLTSKLFQRYALQAHRDVFLFCVFLTALIISIGFTLRSNRDFGVTDVITGVAVGIPNLFCSFFLIMALSRLATSIVYPFYSAGSIVFINFGGWLIFGEKLACKEIGAIALTMIALVLINI